jgi:AraC-like DNA-binding protein/mannose-6-phosphate isomerase-like protein (cupin superfamily)
MNTEARMLGQAKAPDGRSEDYRDYQDVALPMTALVRNQPAGAYNTPHTHRHGQLLYATHGVMRVATDDGLWFLPPRRALWIPAGVVHDQLMLGAVSMRSIYVQADLASRFGERCRVLEVSTLLRELILVLAGQPIEYELEGRNTHVVALILDELAAARTLPLQIPWPTDRRLLVICNAILESPGHARTLEYWADSVGASPRTLIRLFLRQTGMSFRNWVQQVRLASALDRLENGEAIGAVARALGYASASAFSSMFRRVMGESPSAFLAPR